MINPDSINPDGIEVIGISGPTCSGKTQLVAELLGRLDGLASGLSMDEYDLFPAGSEAMEKELRNPGITNWEDPKLFDLARFATDLGTLARGESVDLAARSRESMDEGSERRVVRPARYLLTEGVFTLVNPAALAVMDMTFFIEIPHDVMVERRLNTLRPGSDGNPWDDPDYIRGAMVEGTKEHVLPQRELADVVLNGLRTTEELADEVMQYVPAA